MQTNNSQAAQVAPEELNDKALTTTTGQLSLLDFGGFTEPTLMVFRIEDKTSEDQKRHSQSVRVRKNKEIAEELGLVGKDNKAALDEAILLERDNLKTMMTAMVNKMSHDPKWTGGGMTVVRNNKTGKSRVALNFITCVRSKEITDEQIAKAWGIPIEEVAKFRAHHMKLGSPVEVSSRAV